MTTKKTTTPQSSAAKAAEVANCAKLTAFRTFKELEYALLTPAAWVRYHEVVLSNFEDGPGAVWRVMRMYSKPQHGGLIAVKSQVTRESTPFITLYQETEMPA